MSDLKVSVSLRTPGILNKVSHVQHLEPGIQQVINEFEFVRKKYKRQENQQNHVLHLTNTSLWDWTLRLPQGKTPQANQNSLNISLMCISGDKEQT